MRTFINRADQGDIYIERVGALPTGAVPAVRVGDHHVVAHSETGHHHVVLADHVDMYRLPEEIYECFLVVGEATPLTHLRAHDTHEPIMFEPGTYRVLRQRERAYTPEGWRRAAD